MKAYYIYCVNCETHIESNPLAGGRRVYSTLDKAMDFIREHILSWYKEEDVVTNPTNQYEWLVECAGGKYIWGIEEITIL